MPTKEDRVLAELVEARRTLIALRSELEQPTISRLYETQLKLLRDVKAAKDECHHLAAAMHVVRKP